MDLDQTQAIELDDYHDDTDEEAEQGRQPVFRQKGFPETKFPLFEGDNVIGRQQDVCNIYIPIKALSKQHACIEIRGESHLIYDKGSRNKTKRGKLYLSPNVRYEIRPGDELYMADVSCVYLHQPDGDNEVYDSGSETGSESMFQTAQVLSDTVPDTQEPEDEGRQKFLEATRTEVIEEDDISNTSSDLLQPTQLFGADLGEKARKGRLHEATTLMFAEDSDHSDVETAGNNYRRKKKNVAVAETPDALRVIPADETSTLVLTESDCEDGKSSLIQRMDFEKTADLVGKEGILAAPTQAYVLDSDIEDDDDTDKSNSFLLGAPTQAYGVLEDSENMADNSTTGNASWNGVDESTEAEISGEALTLAYDATFDGTANDSVFTAATQAYGSDNKNSLSPICADRGTQDKNPAKAEEELCVPVDENSTEQKETQSFDPVEGTKHCEDEDSSNKSIANGVGEDFFAAPTMACDLQVEDDIIDNAGTCNVDEEKTEESSKPHPEDATQIFETVPVETSPVKTPSIAKSVTVDQTAILLQDPTQNFETVPIEASPVTSPVRSNRKHIDATVDQTALLPATLCDNINENKEPGNLEGIASAETLEPTLAISEFDVDRNVDPNEDKDSSAETLAVAPTLVVSQRDGSKAAETEELRDDRVIEEPTQAYDMEDEDEEDSEKLLAETQIIPENVSPKSKYKGRDVPKRNGKDVPVGLDAVDNSINVIKKSLDKKSSDNANSDLLSEIPSIEFSQDDTPAISQASSDEPTQAYADEEDAYGNEGIKTDRDKKTGNSSKFKEIPQKKTGKLKRNIKEVELEATQAYGEEEVPPKKPGKSRRNIKEVVLEAAQAYGEDEQISPKKSGKSRRSTRKIPEVELEATQAYGKEEISPKKTEKLRRNIKEVELEATQAYGEEEISPKKSGKSRSSTRKIPEVELEATQAYDEEEISPKKPEKSRRNTPKVPQIELEATQAYGEDEETSPKKSGKSRRNIKEVELEATQAYGEDEQISLKKSGKSRRSTRKIPEVELEATQAYDEEEISPKKTGKSRRYIKEVELEATQAYGEDEQISAKKSGKSRRSTRKIPQIELEATQAYGEEETSPQKSEKSRCNTPKVPQIEMEATQAYGEDEDIETNGTGPTTADILTEPTQAYDMEERISDDPKDIPGTTKQESSSEEIVPDSCGSEENTPAAIPLPSHSPHKSALASPGKKHISPKKVVFVGQSAENVSENVDTGILAGSSNVDKSTKQETEVKSSQNQIQLGTSATGRRSRRSVKVSESTKTPTVVDENILSEEPSPVIPLCSDGIEAADRIDETDTENEDPTAVNSKTKRGKGGKSVVVTSVDTFEPTGRGRRSTSKAKKSTAKTKESTAKTKASNAKTKVEELLSESGDDNSEKIQANPENEDVSEQTGRVSRRSLKKSHAAAPEEETVTKSVDIAALGKSDKADSDFKEPTSSTRRVRGSKRSESGDENQEVPPPQTRRGRARKSTAAPDAKTEQKSTRTSRKSSASDVSSVDDELTCNLRKSVKKDNNIDPASVSTKTNEPVPNKTFGRQRRSTKPSVGADTGSGATVTGSHVANTDSHGVNTSSHGADSGSHAVNNSSHGADNGSHGVNTSSRGADTNSHDAATEESLVGVSKAGRRGPTKRNTISTIDNSTRSDTSSRRRTIAKETLNYAVEDTEPSLKGNKRGKAPGSGLDECVLSDHTSEKGRSAKTSSDSVSEESTQSDKKSKRGEASKDNTDSALDKSGLSADKKPKRGRAAKISENNSLSGSILHDDSIAVDETEKGASPDVQDKMNRTQSRKRSNGQTTDEEVSFTAPAKRGRRGKTVKTPTRSNVKTADEEVASKTPAKRSRKGKTDTITPSASNGVEEEAGTSKTSQGEEKPDDIATPDNRKRQKKSVVTNKVLDISAFSPLVETPGRSKAKTKRNAGGDTSEEMSSTEIDDDFKPAQKKGKKSAITGSQGSNNKPDLPDGDILNSPTTRRKSMEPKPRVVFTGVVDEHGQKITKELGGVLVNSVYDCTHLVTDQVRRTLKFLCCLARGLPIVMPQWLNGCKDAGLFVDPTPFLVADKVSEKKFKFCLQRSIEKAASQSLLEGYKIHVTKSVRPEPLQMKDIIQCAGAVYLKSMPVKAEDGVVVISCEDDRKLCEPALSADVPVLSSEFLLTGILKQEILTESFRLFEDKKVANKRLSTQTGAAASKKRRK